ncbi:oxidoreductase, short chain dehydrogenase/reductase family protein [Calothrix sp. NIES-4071]|nr:oxidoreductase, short chain dehydrogenase/reductase family protein [Calothrix sp. NIES-4071]BAZ54617.1 oxidoreductase, short chain dehydrogenase/reductase family protein [Calothrix sp. NIES-4105]
MSQRVLVTAGASGIGREIVQAFAANGAKVFVCDIDAPALDSLVKDLPDVMTKVCDISKREDIEQMVAFGVDALGGLDVLVNNAGIAGPTAPIEEIDPNDWEKVVQINLNGTFNVTRLAIPHLKKSNAGVIINMSSVAGRFGYASRSPYSTTKWGLIGFTKTLSIELGEYGIRANAILPGAVEGARIQKVFEGRAQLSGQTVEEVRQDSMANQSIKRLVDPRDIAALAVFLASDYGKSISGQMLPIDNDMQKAS